MATAVSLPIVIAVSVATTEPYKNEQHFPEVFTSCSVTHIKELWTVNGFSHRLYVNMELAKGQPEEVAVKLTI